MNEYHVDFVVMAEAEAREVEVFFPSLEAALQAAYAGPPGDQTLRLVWKPEKAA